MTELCIVFIAGMLLGAVGCAIIGNTIQKLFANKEKTYFVRYRVLDAKGKVEMENTRIFMLRDVSYPKLVATLRGIDGDYFGQRDVQYDILDIHEV